LPELPLALLPFSRSALTELIHGSQLYTFGADALFSLNFADGRTCPGQINP